MAVLVAAAIVAQVVTQRTTGCTAQAGTNGGTGLAAYRAAQQRTACRAQATANGRFGTIAFPRTYRTTGCTTDTSADGCASAATELLADNVAQHTTQATANGGSTVTGESALAQQQAEGNGRQSQTHDLNLKGIIRLRCRTVGRRVRVGETLQR